MNNVEIYLDPMCPYCQTAVSIFKEDGIAFDVINLAKSPDRFGEMLERAKRRTVPQIFIGGTHVGGCDDLIEARYSGLLNDLLYSHKEPQKA